MTEEQLELLRSIDVDIEETMERFIGNEGLFLKCLKKFITDNNYLQLQMSIEDGDVKNAFESAHALKGLSANLGLEGVYKEVAVITEIFRTGSLNYDNENLKRLKENYNMAIHVIEQL